MTDFRFKQFQIKQAQSAMKVSTDGVLLGAWANLDVAKTLLDMGTGTGLLALMAAQRSPKAQIIAVELDPLAAQEAAMNAKNSPWHERIQVVQADVREFCQSTPFTFEAILANPPYFPQGVDCRDAAREQARYFRYSHWDWLVWASGCLAETGRMSLVLPFEAGIALKAQAAAAKIPRFYCTRQTNVITKIGKAPQRMLLEFSLMDMPCEQSELVVYQENNQYSDAFKQLTKAFYLAF